MINLDTQTGVKLTLFPDNQPHVQVEKNAGSDVTASLTNSIKLINLLQTVSLLAKPGTLTIPYLMAARYDRQMSEDKTDSFDLKLVASLINACGFSKVKILDPHSPIALQLIDSSESITATPGLFARYSKSYESPILICPDKGARDRAKEIQALFKLEEPVICDKSRDQDGKISLVFPEVEKLRIKDRNCVIVDDLCDGGGTFLAISSQISNQKSISLIITHSIFSKGNNVFKEFDTVFTTDSYSDWTDAGKNITCVPWQEAADWKQND